LPRRCIATRQRQHRNGMLRFVLGPESIVVPDLEEKLPGRGLWVGAERRALEKAIAANLFARAARAPATVPADLLDRVAGLLLRRCLRWLGQTHGAGQVKLGDFQVKDALARGDVAFLIEASDGMENGRAKVLSKAGGLPVVTCFTRTELGEAVGRAQAVHLAIMPGRLGEHFLADARRYAGIMGLNHPQTGGE
jgi:predicted RNA-binding protein YlxR (DUF448 family)/ribosomal protein L7Ae-like RNA K-turn-binding protein